MRKVIIILSSILSVLFIATIAGAIYMMNYALRSAPSSHDIPASYEYIFERPVLRQWVDSLQKEGALKDTMLYSNYDG